ncbi:Hypothetical predicted protein [Podarcis lilfordi]|uniref:Uncharacterized protein n=1 Tax=Podarcis lilfordi TaxID=74358 RepID=A0AA35NUH1_9SAUR|nr:Hypothetical predicted protein [Podarcis lilfordi]
MLLRSGDEGLGHCKGVSEEHLLLCSILRFRHTFPSLFQAYLHSSKDQKLAFPTKLKVRYIGMLISTHGTTPCCGTAGAQKVNILRCGLPLPVL